MMEKEAALQKLLVSLIVKDEYYKINYTGFSRIGGMCSQSSSCTINENSGFSTAFTLAHETGHK